MTPSAYRHGFEFDEAIYLLGHALGRAEVEGRPGARTVAYVGYPRAGSSRRVELIAELAEPRTITVFHFADLTDHFSDLWPQEDR
jgi:hypothetical protein